MLFQQFKKYLFYLQYLKIIILELDLIIITNDIILDNIFHFNLVYPIYSTVVRFTTSSRTALLIRIKARGDHVDTCHYQ